MLFHILLKTSQLCIGAIKPFYFHYKYRAGLPYEVSLNPSLAQIPGTLNCPQWSSIGKLSIGLIWRECNSKTHVNKLKFYFIIELTTGAFTIVYTFTKQNNQMGSTMTLVANAYALDELVGSVVVLVFVVIVVVVLVAVGKIPGLLLRK